MEAPLIRVDFKCSKSIIDDCSDSYYNRYYYDAYLEKVDGEDILIGKGNAVLYLYGKALDDGFDIIEAFEENQHESIYDLMFDGDKLEGTNGLKDDWDYLMSESSSLNILVSDRLEILPEFRHKGYGQIIRQIKRSFFNGSYGIEVLHSFPLQLELFDNDKDDWRAKQQYDSMEHDSKKAFASLNRCYKKDGYKRYKRTEYFYRQP